VNVPSSRHLIEVAQSSGAEPKAQARRMLAIFAASPSRPAAVAFELRYALIRALMVATSGSRCPCPSRTSDRLVGLLRLEEEGFSGLQYPEVSTSDGPCSAKNDDDS
jgi:hypothetical protein